MINAITANEIAKRKVELDGLINNFENKIDNNIRETCEKGRMTCRVFFPAIREREIILEELIKRLREYDYDIRTCQNLSGFDLTISWHHVKG